VSSVPAARPRSWWLSLPGSLLLAALASGALAWWLVALPVATFSNLAKHSGHFVLVYLHMLGGTLTLFLGAANLYIGLTRRGFRYHRSVGTAYLAGGTVNACAAIVLALGQVHDPARAFSFDLDRVPGEGVALATLALAWLVASAMGWRAVRNRRVSAHRAWMTRSYVLTWSFVTCRLINRAPFLAALAGLGRGEALPWLSWIVPLLVCEVALQWRAGAREARGGAGRAAA